MWQLYIISIVYNLDPLFPLFYSPPNFDVVSFCSSDKKRYRKANEFVVVLGATNRFERVNGTIVSDVKSIAYMNTFSMDTMRDDIGLMFLKSGLPENMTHLTVEPILMANQSTPAGVTCHVSGWGKTERVC